MRQPTTFSNVLVSRSNRNGSQMNKDSANDTDILPPTDRAVLPLGKIDDDFMNSFEKHPEKDFGGYETPKSNSQPP